MSTDKTALSYWLPKIEAAGLPTPRTKIVAMSELAQKDMWRAFDGESGASDALERFCADVAEAAMGIGLPCFLRTDHTSGKHNWDETCFLQSIEDVPRHVNAIVEFSECAGLIGLPWVMWAIREFLPTLPMGFSPHYGNMPICREFRFFVEDDRVLCHHPYWPRRALDDGGAPADLDYTALCKIDEELELLGLAGLAAAAGRAAGGAWSVDLLETQRGWYVTDMAEAHKSFHWEDCPNRSPK